MSGTSFHQCYFDISPCSLVESSTRDEMAHKQALGGHEHKTWKDLACEEHMLLQHTSIQVSTVKRFIYYRALHGASLPSFWKDEMLDKTKQLGRSKNRLIKTCVFAQHCRCNIFILGSITKLSPPLVLVLFG
jgi:hypothetical protein